MHSRSNFSVVYEVLSLVAMEEVTALRHHTLAGWERYPTPAHPGHHLLKNPTHQNPASAPELRSEKQLLIFLAVMIINMIGCRYRSDDGIASFRHRHRNRYALL